MNIAVTAIARLLKLNVLSVPVPIYIKCHGYSSSLDFNHPNPYTHQVRGTEKVSFAQKFKGQNPVQMRMKSVLLSDPSIILQNNLHHVKSDGVYKNVADEARARRDRATNR